jgi:GTP-binding protein
VENKFGKYNFIDTAGIRRKSRIVDEIEKYSIIRAKMAIERSDVCVIMIDAEIGCTEQDTKVAGLALDAGKACVIAVNKWDAIERDTKTMSNFRKRIEVDFAFMNWAPVVFISAKTGQRIDNLFENINAAASNNAARIKTGTLNELLAQITTRVQPPTDKGKRLKIFYITQPSTKPPTFVSFCNNKDLFHFSYQRYIENRIRETFALSGTPIRMIIRERGEK